MQGFNRAIICGHVGKEPDIRYKQDGTALAMFSLATTESWKDKSGQKQEKTQWHRCIAAGRLAEIIGEYVKKGDPVLLEGSIDYGKYTDKSGVEKYTTDIRVKELQMLKPKDRDEPRQERAAKPEKTKAAPPSDEPFPDDDIPF